MRFTLEDYQSKAVEDVLAALAKARQGYAADGERTAVRLTAPTGAGKTVIATGVLEGLYLGTPAREAIKDLTVLWLTDDPNLNRQTIDKILQASGGGIDANRIRFLFDTDEPTLEPGYIYFVHIQALQKNSSLHALRPDGTLSDFRTYGAWEMIANTATRRGEDFVVIWDEAHRGSGGTDSERRTIAGTIVNGGVTNVGTTQPAAPIVLGISATPERFEAAMKSEGRTMRPVDVPPGEVRQSGLLKDRILIRHVAEGQSADNTMLSLAVQDLKASDEAWRKHHRETGDRPVEPLMIVQVPQGDPTALLSELLPTIESAWPALSGYAIAHSFGDPKGPLKVGDRSIRHLAPDAISGDDQVRVVFFKDALTTGWDCPRAEVLVSFQGKESFTEIAQLIGRLVRTPLAQRVEGDDRLNEVVAYLPGFKVEHVARVVKSLTENETVQVPVLIDPEYCKWNPDVPREVQGVLEALPSYERPASSPASRTQQLMRLAAALNEQGLVANGSKKARQWIVAQISAVDAQQTEAIDAKVADYRSLTIGTTVVGMGAEVTSETTKAPERTVERDLDVYFQRAKRLLPDGSASWYYKHLCDGGMDDVDAAVRVAALADLGFRDVVEQEALELIEAWRDAHASAVAKKPAAARRRIEGLWQTGSDPMVPTTPTARDVYPASTVRVVGDKAVDVPLYPFHLYAISDGRPGAGMFPVDTSRSSWEAEVLRVEVEGEGGDEGDETMLGWYRNPSSGAHALAVPYEFGNTTQLLHPDFLFFYRDGDKVVVDIVDPHRHDLNDTSAKWAALSRYATSNGDIIRRAVAVMKNSNNELRALDLTKAGIAAKVEAAGNKNLIEALFATEGMAYY